MDARREARGLARILGRVFTSLSDRLTDTFRNLKRKGTVTEVPADQLTAAIEGAGGKRGRGELESAQVPALPAGAVPAPRQEDGQLLELLDENPDEVAGMLRGWLASTNATAGADR